jgi:adenylate cyclase
VRLNPLQSAGRRFLAKFGVALLWALVFGLAIGALAAQRVSFNTQLARLGVLSFAAQLLESAERPTIDWRARALGGTLSPHENVVLVAVDDETISNARESNDPRLASQPWPRSTLGALVRQATDEGARTVLLDEDLERPSPQVCAGELNQDDDSFAEQLLPVAGRLVLPCSWTARVPFLVSKKLVTHLLKVGHAPTAELQRQLVTDVLRLGLPAYVKAAPLADAVWAGVENEEEAKKAAKSLRLKQSEVAVKTIDDDRFHVDRTWLVLHTATLTVEGIDPSKLLPVNTLTPPIARALLPQTRVGLMVAAADSDGVTRQVPLLVAHRDELGKQHVLPTSALAAVMQHLGVGTLRYQSGELILADDHRIAMSADGMIRVAWSADSGGQSGNQVVRRVIPAWRLLVNAQDAQNNRVKHHDNGLQGALVVAAERRTQRDIEAADTPLGRLSKSALEAQVISSLLLGKAVRQVSPATDFWVTLAFAVMGGLLAVALSGFFRRPGWLAWAFTVAAVGWLHLFVARQLYVDQFRQVAVAAPLLAFSATFFSALGYARTIERGFREFMLRSLGTAVRADVYSQIERDSKLVRPKRREIAILVSQIEGFTQVTQTAAPQGLVSWLQQYLTEVTALVLDQKGHVDKYLGDGVMAFWGAPLPVKSPVDAACQAALAMGALFEARIKLFPASDTGTLRLRAGIDYGSVIAGEMGTRHRTSYSVLGEGVTTAFLLERLAKRYQVRILVSESVVQLAQRQFVFRTVDRLCLREEGPTVTVSELVGLSAELGEQLPWFAQYETAVNFYFARQFEQAEALLTTLNATRIDSNAARFLRQCRWFAKHPPADGWDGTAPQASDAIL